MTRLRQGYGGQASDEQAEDFVVKMIPVDCVETSIC